MKHVNASLKIIERAKNIKIGDLPYVFVKIESIWNVMCDETICYLLLYVYMLLYCINKCYKYYSKKHSNCCVNNCCVNKS